MSWGRAAVLAAAALGLAAGAPAASGAGQRALTLQATSQAQLSAALQRVSRTGGTVVLGARSYARLVIDVKAARPVTVTARPGARVEQVLIHGARNVTFGGVTVGPIRGEAMVEVRDSRHVVLQNLLVTAEGTRFRSFVHIPRARNVTIRRSEFTHCGDGSPEFTYCVLLWRGAHSVRIEDSHFHDCRGCDFVHGRFGSGLVIRRNRFERALPCSMGKHRCGHQDLVQLFAGRGLRVEGNHFGVYREGGAQLYLTNDVDHATIVNNVFVGHDPKVPGYPARVGIVVGSAASKRLPLYAKIVNNTILTGFKRRDGFAGSIRMSSRYGAVQKRKRPVVANNVLALLRKRGHVCSAAQRFTNNVVLRGVACGKTDRVADARLDADGKPKKASPLIDAALKQLAPKRDMAGRKRGEAPDIGAFEFRAG